MDALRALEVAATDPRVQPLVAAHLILMRGSSPACSVHAMEAPELEASGARFFAIIEGNVALAMGALKPISPMHGELKSMHVRSDSRGRGLADAILYRLLDEARRLRMRRVSLETGSQDVFAPARAFYARHGFAICDPFEGYGPDPNSCFMTLEL